MKTKVMASSPTMSGLCRLIEKFFYESRPENFLLKEDGSISRVIGKPIDSNNFKWREKKGRFQLVEIL